MIAKANRNKSTVFNNPPANGIPESNGGGGGTWGSITGTLSSQIDLQTALDAKSNNLIRSGTYSTVLTFDTDQDIYQDLTGQSVTFTLGTGNVNGVGIILRLNKPTAITFPGTFEAQANSAALDATKLNVYTLVFFTNWNGSGMDHVIYSNSLYAAQ